MAALVGAVIGIALWNVLLFALGYLLHWPRSATMPKITGSVPATVVQAINLMFFASILFGGHSVIAAEHRPVHASATTAPSRYRHAA